MPRPDDGFSELASAFVDFANAHGTSVGLSAGEVTALNNAFTSNWSPKYAAHQAAQAAALGARATKDGARAALAALIRAAAGRMQVHPAMTDAWRAKAHLRIYDKTRTRAPLPTTRPLVVVDTSLRLQHTISWRDETTPTSRAKPRGVKGAEIWYFIGPTPPSNPAQCRFAALDSATPHLLEHNPADVGKLCHYLLRWVNSRGEAGPWSETVSATIGA